MVNPCEDANISARRRAVPLLYNTPGRRLYVVKKYRSPTTQRESIELSNKIKKILLWPYRGRRKVYLSYLKWSRNKEKEMKDEKKVKEEKEVKREYTRRQRRKEKAEE